MKAYFSKSYLINEGLNELRQDETPVPVQDWSLEDAISSVFQTIDLWKRNNWFEEEPVISSWFYELEPYDQALMLIEAANCLAKSENQAWYWAKDFLIDVLLHGTSRRDVPDDAFVWLDDSWNMCCMHLYSEVVGTICVHLPGWDDQEVGEAIDASSLGKAWYQYRPWSGVYRQSLGVRMLQDRRLLKLMAAATRPCSMPKTILKPEREALAKYLGARMEDIAA